jgi:hypothetical protein
MVMAINSTARAMENMEYVRSLLKQRQPEFAAALEWAAMLAEKAPQSQRRRLVLRQATLILSSAQVPVTESGARSHLGGASGSLDDLPVFGGGQLTAP